LLASKYVRGWEQETIFWTRRWASQEQRLLTDRDLSKRAIRIPITQVRLPPAKSAS